MKITKCENGYILENDNILYVATDIQEVFTRMLNIFENKSAIGMGSKYGKVIVTYENDFYANDCCDND